MKRKIIIICFTLFILVAFAIRSIVLGDTNSKVIEQYGLDKKEWALYNYGQEVEGVKGIEGIDINVVCAWDKYKKLDEVIVGVIDSGIDYKCQGLKNKYWYNQKEIANDGIDNDKNGFVDDYYGWDFFNNDNTIYDNYLYDYHGTYIANAIISVASNAQILSGKFLKTTEGDATDGIEAIKYAISNGAKIINCSWCFETEEKELHDIIKDNPDILFVCATGNTANNFDEYEIYPASYELDNLIAVMAIDNTGAMYEFSGYGKLVDIAAPGKSIYVTVAEDDKTTVDGTSIATAYVTGAATMLKGYAPQLEAKDLKQILLSSSTQLKTLEGKCKTEGYLNIYEAFQLIEEGKV